MRQNQNLFSNVNGVPTSEQIGKVLLKQGFTNYQYILADKSGKIDFKNAIDGNHFQTENNYTALIYYRGNNDRYDRVIGIANTNSEEIKN